MSASSLAITSSRLLSTVLNVRGIKTAEAATQFLSPSTIPLGKPLLLPDMERAVATIRAAIDASKRIVVFGDYDVDGLTSTAMIVRVLRRLGGQPVAVIPHRMDDGYGLTLTMVDRLVTQGVDLLITVDSGSSNHSEFEDLIHRGVQVVVVDHHRYSGPLPETVAYVSPRRPDNRYPFVDHAAVGVCYTLVRALLGDDDAEMYLPYVALGTIADVVELRDENRALVTRGLAMLRRWKLPGLKALCAAAGIDQQAVGAWEIGYVIGPRLNAAGRIDSPQAALDLLLADDATTATPLALKLSDLNTARREMTRRIQSEAEASIGERGEDALPAIIVSGESWGIGVVGLVAGRLAEAFNRPAIVFERGPDISRGSARSAGDVNIVEAIAASAELLERFGGHRNAAGLTIATANLERFEQELCATIFDMLGGQLPVREIVLDAAIGQEELHLGTVELLSQLEPFGRGNEEPRLLLHAVRHRYEKTSRDGRHLLFHAVDDRGRGHGAVFFNAGDRLRELLDTPRIDIATNLRLDTWDGRERLKLHVSDFRPTT
ncbi:MAG: single-stranded-DNA-specific exonuclease RecJ [Chloroflexota bacterium]|nr:single-stranded-DNA-specific exonuclease RecJ [Chloroflexota bacterium]